MMVVGGEDFGEVGNSSCLVWVCWYSARGGGFEWGVVCVWGDYVVMSSVVGIGGLLVVGIGVGEVIITCGVGGHVAG